MPYFIDLFRPFYIYYIGSIVLVPILTKGDIVFVFIDKVEKLPLFEILETQLDVIDKNNFLPLGYFNAIQNNRKIAYNNLKLYLMSPSPKSSK